MEASIYVMLYTASDEEKKKEVELMPWTEVDVPVVTESDRIDLTKCQESEVWLW